jgi:hypothetical protein
MQVKVPTGISAVTFFRLLPVAADPVSLVYFDKVLMTRAALARFEEMFA